MTKPGLRTRAPKDQAAASSSTWRVAPPADHDLLAQLRRRRAGSRRLPALCCGHRDTFDCLVRPVGPSTFSLAPEQLRKHANDLAVAGWSIEEIVSVLAIDPVRPTS
jgi:hypothetical protein